MGPEEKRSLAGSSQSVQTTRLKTDLAIGIDRNGILVVYKQVGRRTRLGGRYGRPLALGCTTSFVKRASLALLTTKKHIAPSQTETLQQKNESIYGMLS